MANYPISIGHPDLSANSKYIPTLYAKKLLIEFYKASVFSDIANTDYEGQIKEQGDKVEIRMLPDITINTHTKGQALTYENPESSTVTLLIDKGKYWAISIDPVDKKQSDIEFVNQWAVHASETLRVGIDYDVLSNIYSDVSSSNSGATAGVNSSSFNLGATGAVVGLTYSNILNYIVDCGTVLDEQNIPDTGRWMVLPPWACGLIKKGDLKDASLAGDATSIMRNGLIGMIDRFKIYKSNNLATASDTSDGSTAVTAHKILFGHPSSLTFASQMVMSETLKNPTAFGDLLRALQVYGYKVVKPEAIGCLSAYNNS